MKVNIRFLCIDIYDAERNDYDFELNEGATLEQALAAAREEYPHVAAIPLSELKKSVLLINEAKQNPDAVLRDGDRVTVLRPLGGG